MDETTTNDSIPDLKDIEAKIGRKTPEGLIKWMRDEASLHHREESKLSYQTKELDTGKKSLDEKIKKLKIEMAHLRSVDVKILQQLLAVHEGIESVKWLLEERSTLTSHCSSLTSSQYSLGEGPDTSWRGSWSSLQDSNDKLDNISVGSYLDTLADDMDEYGPLSSECNTLTSDGAPRTVRGGGSGAAGGARVVPGTGAGVGGRLGAGTESTEGEAAGPGSPQSKAGFSKDESLAWTKSSDTGKGKALSKAVPQKQVVKSNGVGEKGPRKTGGPESTRPCLNDKQGKSQSLKPYKNGKIDREGCKMNGKMHLEYDAHWRWVQSQDDVTFL
ncbi:leucine rich adaptor protein 1 [Aplochiton taeniatus]